VDQHCLVAVLQTPCPHVLLAYNVPPAACLACARYRPCHVASWKIRARPDGRSWWQCHQGIFVYFNSPQPVELHGTHDGSGTVLSQEARAGATRLMATPELPYARRHELVPWAVWHHPICLEPGLRSWGHGTHGGTWAILSQEAGAGGTRGVAALELPVPGGITRCHGHVGACECTSYPSSWLRACMWGYPICRVSTKTHWSPFSSCLRYVGQFENDAPHNLMWGVSFLNGWHISLLGDINPTPTL
jgi:hypothetical protein